jgi:phosphonate transport system permease protein
VSAPVGVRPPKPRPALGAWSMVAVAVVITIVAGSAIDFDLLPLFRDTGRGWFIVSQFFAPDWGYLGRTVAPLLDTLSIAVVATGFGCVLALAVAMLASRVTTRNVVVYRVAKNLLSVIRSLPDVVWGMLFVAFVGVGALAGMLALVVFNLGILAKLTSETIDAVDPGPLEAADAAGANAVQRARVAVVPQILPNFASYTLYVFELNVRASVVLGFVGAGGIGTQIAVELARFNYDNLSALIVVLFLVVFAIDQLSGLLRRRLAA